MYNNHGNECKRDAKYVINSNLCVLLLRERWERKMCGATWGVGFWMVIYIGIVGVRFCKQIRREKKEKKMGLRSKMFVMVMVIGALGSAPLMVESQLLVNPLVTINGSLTGIPGGSLVGIPVSSNNN